MAPNKKKNKKKGVDFLKVKHKVGRKLPPPKNETKIEIKSKAIVLPEQSLALEKEGLAVNKKQQTLKELLMQTTHHNVNVRKDALLGIKDLLVRHPKELKLHKLAIIEKLSGRMSDANKGVREALYALLKSLIFPELNEGVMEPLFSIILAHIFNAMTQLALDIRLMAFKFLDLAVKHYRSIVISSHISKVLQFYADMFGKSATFSHDKRNLMDILNSFIDYMSCLYTNIQQTDLSSNQENRNFGALHMYKSSLAKKDSTFSILSTNDNGKYELLEHLQMLVPVLLEIWTESASVACLISASDIVSLECMLSVIEGLIIICKCTRRIENHIKEERSTLCQPITDSVGLNFEKWIKSIIPAVQKRIISLLPLIPSFQGSQKIQEHFLSLNIKICELALGIMEWVKDELPFLEQILQFIESLLQGQNPLGCHKQFGDGVVSVVPFVPRLILHISETWKQRLLEAFSEAFERSAAKPSLQIAFISAIQEMIFYDLDNGLIQNFQIRWIHLFPKLLWELKHKNSDSSKVVLYTLLYIGRCACANSLLQLEYTKLQQLLVPFFSLRQLEGKKERCIYGPFGRLPKGCQELAVDCLYHFSNISSSLLESLGRCCLCHELDLSIVSRIIQVIHAAYCKGHLKISDHLSFLLSLILCNRHVEDVANCVVSPVNNNIQADQHIRLDKYKGITRVVCSCLSGMGDERIILELLMPTIMIELANNDSLSVRCSLLRVMVVLSSKFMILPKDNVDDLSQFMLSYLMQIGHDAIMDYKNNQQSPSCGYYILPCMYLLSRSDRLAVSLLKRLESISVRDFDSESEHSRHLCSVLWAASQAYRNAKLHPRLLACESSTKTILDVASDFQASHAMQLSLEERTALRNLCTKLKVSAAAVHKWEIEMTTDGR